MESLLDGLWLTEGARTVVRLDQLTVDSVSEDAKLSEYLVVELARLRSDIRLYDDGEVAVGDDGWGEVGDLGATELGFELDLGGR